MSDYMDRYKMEKDLRWRDLSRQVPFIRLPDGYEFAPIPPFAGAAARMLVRKTGSENAVSVYLDTDNSLGFWTNGAGEPEPYWEVYPVGGDTGRCEMADAETLVGLIVQGLSEQAP